jgi:hypothetical protein
MDPMDTNAQDQAPASPAVAQGGERLATILRSVGHPPPRSTHPRGRKLLKAHKDWIVRFVAELPSPKLAGEILGVSTTNIQEQRRTDPEFRAAYDRAIADGRQLAAGLVYEEAHGVGLDHVVVKTPEGAEVVAVPKRRSERLLELIYRLEHAPEFQTHNVNVKGEAAPGTITLKLEPRMLDALTRQERNQLTLLINKMESARTRTLEHRP